MLALLHLILQHTPHYRTADCAQESMPGFVSGEHACGAAEEASSQTALAGFGISTGSLGVFYARDLLGFLGVVILMRRSGILMTGMVILVSTCAIRRLVLLVRIISVALMLLRMSVSMRILLRRGIR